ncbi:hypothetical protein MAR_019896 [Mya arenaria]|uniref:Uncharacterized protein n=1 Tax=Mya arenaria TaxID=6604 RepID=A0ABY7E6U8_MYAAR|nr:hypothetical protein MAR_019896 [Mya arenaria]
MFYSFTCTNYSFVNGGSIKVILDPPQIADLNTTIEVLEVKTLKEIHLINT